MLSLARQGLRKEFANMSKAEAYLALPSNINEVDSETKKTRNCESG
jgi:hypothetical protein